MAEVAATPRPPSQLPIEVWQLVMDTVFEATTYTTFYTNQDDYRSWALVSRTWSTCAQSVLFRTVELPDTAHLYRFSALLYTAPHLAVYVRTLRAYSRDLNTRDNVVALLPAILGRGCQARLPNLRTLLLTRITAQDTWHPHAARAPKTDELEYMPLDVSHRHQSEYSDMSGGFWGGLGMAFAGLSELYLSYVTFETFGALARTLHALRNLRLLSCLEVRWCALGPVPECLAWKGEGGGKEEGQGHGQGQGAFLPKLEDLTIAYMDLHGVERLVAALGRSAPLKELYIDCPHYCPVSTWSDPSSVDPVTGMPLGIDLRAFSQLRSLWLALPYTRHACKDLPELVAALLRTWIPTNLSTARKLTLTPSYESDFMRAEFADVLHALGPVIEDILGECDPPDWDGKENADREDDGRRGAWAEVEVCVVDKADRHGWWREEAHASFARLGARGRLAVSFEKCFWPEAQWLDDSDEEPPEEASSPAQHANVGGSVDSEAHTHSGPNLNPGERATVGSSVFGGRASDGGGRRRRGPSRFTRLRPSKLKRAFHVIRRNLSKIKPARLSWKKKRRAGTGAHEIVFAGR